MSDAIRYFAYGSNMNPRRMRERGVTFLRRERAILSGYQLRFNKRSQADPRRGAANIVPLAASRVEGVFYELPAAAIARLDEFEGFPLHYTRETLTVDLELEATAAVAYVAHPTKIDDALLPAADYLAHLLAAADLLSDEYLNLLHRVRTAESQ